MVRLHVILMTISVCIIKKMKQKKCGVLHWLMKLVFDLARTYECLQRLKKVKKITCVIGSTWISLMLSRNPNELWLMLLS